MAAGQVTPTNNPQVALYTMTLPYPGMRDHQLRHHHKLRIADLDAEYQHSWRHCQHLRSRHVGQHAFHMQAAVQFVNGITANDVDHTFTTQAIPANMRINLTTATTPGMIPQPGLELINPVSGSTSGVIVTDLSGNTLWAYANPGEQLAELHRRRQDASLMPIS